MDGILRWVVTIFLVAAIIGLIALARGEPQHGDPTAPPISLTAPAHA
jgi:hypothetical protein